MRSPFRLFLISAGVFGILLVFFILFDSTLLNNYILNVLTEKVSTPTTIITAEGLSILFVGLQFATLKVTLMKFFLNLVAEQVSTRCLSPSILWGSPRCAIHANLYGGTLDGEVSTSTAATMIHSMTMDNVMLSQHPQIMAIGITGGALHATLQELDLRSGALPQKATLQIKNLSLSRPVTLTPLWTKLPFPVVIPAFIVESLTGEIGADRTIAIDMRSNLGSINGSIGENQTISLKLSLSQKGLDELRVPLSLLCAESVLQSGSPIRISGRTPQLRCEPSP